jgi:tetratricopeptide (TPR) repeat protein
VYDGVEGRYLRELYSMRVFISSGELLAGLAIVLTATFSIRAVADEQPRAPILIPNVQEPEEMRVAPLPKTNTVLTPADRMLGEAITNGKNDVQAMLPAINRVIASYPEYAAAYIMRLGALCGGSDKDAVLSDINSALKYSDSSQAFGETLKQSVGSLYGMRAKIEYLSGDYTGAFTDLEKATRADLTKPSEFVNSGAAGPENTASICTWTQPDLDGLVQRFPGDYRPYLFRGLYFGFFAHFTPKWATSAVDNLNKAGELNTKSPLPYFFAADILSSPFVYYGHISDLRWTDAARDQVARDVLRYYDKALAVDPNLIPALKGRANQYLNLKQWQQALEDYNKVIAAEPRDWVDYHDRGLAKMEVGAPYDEISDFTASINIKGRELSKTNGYENRANAYMKTGQWELAIKDLTTAISLQIGGGMLLGNVSQFRAIYPEYAAASDEMIARKLNQTFYPDMTYEGFSEHFLTGRPLASTIIPDIYLKRSDAYLQKGHWRRAFIDFRRATNGFPDYAAVIDRWRQFSQNSNTHNYIDMKTFDATRGGSVRLWIKEAQGESDAAGPYRLFRFELNCNAEQIRTLSWAEYDTSGSVVRSGEGEGRWGSVMPDTLGEVLEHDACGNNEQISPQVAMPAPNPPTSRPNKKTEPVPRWGMQLTVNWSESKAWATYRLIQKQYASLIGDREPIVIRSRDVERGTVRYNIRIPDDDRSYLERLCQKLIAAGGACVVLRNDRG